MFDMKSLTSEELSKSLSVVRLPRYEQLPNMGLFLEQTAKYINQTLACLGCVEITGSMIRNYVKMGLVKNPVHKAYYADHIGHLISITILKLVLPLENIRRMIELQEAVYADDVAYDYFCMELENMISFRFGRSDVVKEVGETNTLEKDMLRSAIIAISHIIYLDVCFKHTPKSNDDATGEETKE